jgi:hypothetical protein
MAGTSPAMTDVEIASKPQIATEGRAQRRGPARRRKSVIMKFRTATTGNLPTLCGRFGFERAAQRQNSLQARNRPYILGK